jgi:carboxylesterase type B
VIDGVELSGVPAALLKQGKQADVPILFGTNRDEGSTFTYNQSGHGDGNRPINGSLPELVSMYSLSLFSYQQMLVNHRHTPRAQSFSTGLFTNASELECWVRAVFGANATALVQTIQALYHPVCAGGPNGTCGASIPAGPVFNAEGITSWWWALSRLIGDWVLSCPARRAARVWAAQNSSNNVYLYHFNHTPNMSLNQGTTQYYGAFHGSEVPFVFHDTIELVDSSEVALSAAMVQYWVGFAYHGDPNLSPPGMMGGINGLPEWVPHTLVNDATMILGDTADGHQGFANVSVYKALKEQECDFWDTVLPL